MRSLLSLPAITIKYYEIGILTLPLHVNYGGFFKHTLCERRYNGWT